MSGHAIIGNCERCGDLAVLRTKPGRPALCSACRGHIDRHCRECRADISHRGPSAKFCELHAAASQRQRNRQHMRRVRRTKLELAWDETTRVEDVPDEAIAFCEARNRNADRQRKMVG